MPDYSRLFVLSGILIFASALVHTMASHSAGKRVIVDCTVITGADLPAGFAPEFCSVLSGEVNRHYPESKAPAHIEVALARKGPFSLTARVKVHRTDYSGSSEDFNLSAHDGALRPSIAASLVFPILQRLE